MIRAETFYRALLYCYPAAFRHEYGDQMLLMFAEQLGEIRRTRGAFRAARLWLDAAWDALTVAPKEHCHVILQDLRYALRTMKARPGFTGVAILSLGLGIGANTAIFSMWHGVLRAPLPGVFKPEQLVILSNPDTAGGWHGNVTGVRDWLTYEEFEQLRDLSGSFSGVMASQSFLSQWGVRAGGAATDEARGRMVSGGYFEVLGVRPELGRLFTAEDDRAAQPFAVISHDYWQRRFGGRPDVLGRALALPKAAMTIIGVTPKGFVGETVGQQPDIWLPLRLQPSILQGESALHDVPPSKLMWLHVFGRLKPGVTAVRAEAEANAIFKAGLESFYGAVTSPERRREYLDQRLKIQSGARGASETRSEFAASLTALLAAVGLLLLIACANLANLLLARGAARTREMAIRLSLGASRGRLIRQLITESVVLAGIGGIAGLAIAHTFHGALEQMIVLSDRDFQIGFSLDLTALVFTAAVTLAAAILFGLLPAWRATRTDAVLREHSRGGIGGIGQARWGRALVGLQLAFSLPLLAGAGLLARTLYNLEHVQLGYSPGRLLHVHIDAGASGYDAPRSAALFQDLLSEIRRIPGVQAASFSSSGIFTGMHSGSTIEVEGYTPKRDRDREAVSDLIGPRYFSTLGVSIVLGREILESDGPSAPRVCVINEAFTEHFFAGRNPIGLRVTSVDNEKRTAYQVAGVAGNARTQGLRGDVAPQVYIPAAQPPGTGTRKANFLIRTATETPAVMPDVRQAFHHVDASLPILSARTVEEQMAPLTAQDRVIAQLAAVFGFVAVTLAAIGLYGVLSYSVTRRRSEIAIRMALGAQSGRVVSMILGETSGLVALGLVLGVGLAYAGSRVIDSRLYGVAPQDPVTLALAIAVLLLVALGAAYLPARRASKLDPMAALRQE